MKNVIKFLIFLIYSSSIFFLPNNKLILIFIIINLFAIISLLNIKSIKNIIVSTFKIFPFIIFTFVINCLLDNFINALWIGIKLIIVCNITITYSKTTNVIRSCRNYTTIMYSSKNI